MAPLLAKIPCCNVSKIITKTMYVVHLKSSVAAIIQCEKHYSWLLVAWSYGLILFYLVDWSYGLVTYLSILIHCLVHCF
jgi:hypothetical protein